MKPITTSKEILITPILLNRKEALLLAKPLLITHFTKTKISREKKSARDFSRAKRILHFKPKLTHHKYMSYYIKMQYVIISFLTIYKYLFILIYSIHNF